MLYMATVWVTQLSLIHTVMLKIIEANIPVSLCKVNNCVCSIKSYSNSFTITYDKGAVSFRESGE